VRLLGCARRLAHIAVLLGISVSAFSATAPTAGDLQRCAGIAAPDARLACYDALAGRPADRAPPAMVASPSPAPAAPVAPPAAAAANDPRNFGLTPAQIQPTKQGPNVISAQIAKIIVDSRTRRSLALLDNGEVWTFVDPAEDAGLNPGDPITIKRAALGSFLLITPSKHSYHVHRAQ